MKAIHIENAVGYDGSLGISLNARVKHQQLKLCWLHNHSCIIEFAKTLLLNLKFAKTLY